MSEISGGRRSPRSPGQDWVPAGRCGLVVVDIAAFGDRARSDHVLQHVRNALYEMVSESFSRCHVPLQDCYVEDRGDGIMVVVPVETPVATLASSLIDWLRAGLRKYNEVSSEVARIRLRMALHSGEVHADRHGIAGAAVNHVFRLIEARTLKDTLADSDDFLAFIVSDHVYQDVLRHAPDLVDPNEFEQVEVRVKETVADAWIRVPGRPPSRPPRAVATHRPAPGVVGPRPVTSFVGRQVELDQLNRLVNRSRLVTLVGPGGTGKTRLAVETLRALTEDADPVCADGAHLIDLTGYQAGDDLCRALLTGLQLATRSSTGPAASRPAAEALVAALQTQRVLVVLDNCEQLLDEVAEVAEVLLNGTENTVLLATSREALGVDGETTFPVGPLAAPPPGSVAFESMLEFPAVRLFIDRASAVDPTFKPDAESYSDIANICRRLDGLPLPIELAAARIRALTTSQIAELLADRFQLLSSGSRTTPRHRTLQAVVDWSYDLLDHSERRMFVSLAVFQSGFRLAEAHQFGLRLGVPCGTMTDLVIRLVCKSLLQATVGDDGAMRYRMLETLREYGMARLLESGNTDEVAEYHAEVYMELAEQQGTALRTPAQSTAIRTLEREDDNIRSAFDFACRTGRHEIVLRLVDALGWYLWMRGERVFGWPGLLRALSVRAEEQDSLRRARALIWTCHLGAVDVAEPEALEHGEQARVILEGLGLTESAEYAICMHVGAFAFFREGNHVEGDVWLQRSLRLVWKLGDSWLQAWATIVAGIGHALRGEFEAAVRQLTESMRHFSDIGDAWGEHRSRVWLSRVHESTGDLIRARKEAEAALSLVCSLDLGEAEAPLVCWLARLHLKCGDPQAARARLAEIERTSWWRSSVEAVAWMSDCLARLYEIQAQSTDGEPRAELFERAARHYEDAADGLRRVGLWMHSVNSRCRQAVALSRAGKAYTHALRTASDDAATQADPRALAFVMGTVVIIEPRESAAAHYLIDELGLRAGPYRASGQAE